jgi:Do/DeqQ family serine protease
MRIGSLFTSKKFFAINLVLVGLILGFILSFITFSCSSSRPKDSALAQDDGQTPLDIPANVSDFQASFRNVAARVLPVVVELKIVEVTTQTVPKNFGWPWNFLLPDQEEEDTTPDEQEFRNQGLGSGVIVRKEKDTFYVLTNNHVAGTASEIKVVLYDEREFTATLVGKDERKDLALIKFTADDPSIPVAVLGDSDDIYVGDWVLAVGSPFGLVSSVTAGIVSAKGRQGPQDNISDFIQTDAAINQGNSGGALVNLRGEVVGINTWITTPTGGSVGLGFSIPINNAKKAIDDFINKGSVEYGWLGVSIQDPYISLAKDLGIDAVKGGFILNVYKNSPAYKAGILPGDYVTKVNGRSIKNADDLVRTVGDLEPSKDASFEVIRAGKKLALNVHIGLRQESQAIAEQISYLWPGFNVVPIDDVVRQELNLDKKLQGLVVVSIERKTKAQVAGLRVGDVITRINTTDLKTAADFYRVLNDEATKELTFYYTREGNQYFFGIVR